MYQWCEHHTVNSIHLHHIVLQFQSHRSVCFCGLGVLCCWWFDLKLPAALCWSSQLPTHTSHTVSWCLFSICWYLLQWSSVCRMLSRLTSPGTETQRGFWYNKLFMDQSEQTTAVYYSNVAHVSDLWGPNIIFAFIHDLLLFGKYTLVMCYCV